MKTIRTLRSLVAFLCLAGLGAVVACAQPATPPAAPQAAKPAANATPAGTPRAEQLADSLVYATTALTATMDPMGTLSNSGMQAARLAHEALTVLNDKGEVLPMLAESWRMVNPTTWEFRLRGDVRFHNGDHFNADAAIATVNRLVTSTDPNHRNTQTNRVAGVAGAQKIDDRSLTITTRAPNPIFLRNVSLLFMSHPKLYDPNDRTILSTPIGTGPFKITGFREGQFIEAEALSEHWRAVPSFKRLRLVQVPEAATAIAGLRSGDIDIAFDVPPDTMETLRSNGLQVIVKQMNDINVLDLSPLQDTPLKDKRIRHAFNHAVDKEAVNRTVYQGTGRVVDGQLATSDVPGYNPNLRAFAYDVATARRLMAEGGQPNGFRIRAGASQAVGRVIMEPVQAYLKAIGVDMEVEYLEFARFSALGQGIEPGKHPVWHTRTNYFQTQDVEQALRNYTTAHSSRRMANPEFDTILTAAAQEFDMQRRNQLLQQAAAIMREEAPTLFMHQHGFVWGASAKVQNFAPLYDTTSALETVRKLR